MRGSTESMTESPAGPAVPCFTVHRQEPKLRKAGLGALAHGTAKIAVQGS